jgi:DNA-binding NarL/FixJ family response regulator
MIRIPVAVRSDDAVVRAGMITMLRQYPELEVLGDNASETAVLVLCLDVVDEDSLVAMRRSVGSGSGRTVLVVGTIEEAHLLDTIECGVVTVVRRREANSVGLLRAIKAAQSGAGELPPDLLGGLLAQVGRARREQGRQGVATVPGLAAREVDVLKLVAEGFDTREIADKLSYSERTVKNVLHGLVLRLNLRNRAHAVAYAARHGYL